MGTPSRKHSAGRGMFSGVFQSQRFWRNEAFLLTWSSANHVRGREFFRGHSQPESYSIIGARKMRKHILFPIRKIVFAKWSPLSAHQENGLRSGFPIRAKSRGCLFTKNATGASRFRYACLHRPLSSLCFRTRLERTISPG